MVGGVAPISFEHKCSHVHSGQEPTLTLLLALARDASPNSGTSTIRRPSTVIDGPPVQKDRAPTRPGKLVFSGFVFRPGPSRLGQDSLRGRSETPIRRLSGYPIPHLFHSKFERGSVGSGFWGGRVRGRGMNSNLE